MKIYNEIITIFNDETQKWETISENSFEYNGIVVSLARSTEGGMPGAGQPGYDPSGASGPCICGVTYDEETPCFNIGAELLRCCHASDAMDMRDESDDVLVLGAPLNSDL